MSVARPGAARPDGGAAADGSLPLDVPLDAAADERFLDEVLRHEVLRRAHVSNGQVPEGQGGPRRSVGLLPPDTFRLVFEQAEVGLALLDLDGVPLAMNRTLRASLGPGGEDLVELSAGALLRCVQEVPRGGETFLIGQGLAGRMQVVLGPGEASVCYLLTAIPEGTGEDPLTGLPGRNALLNRITGALAQERSVDINLVVVDLDDFKLVNDQHGHVIGDEVLVAAAGRLLATVRPEDSVCRWGGDEFAILLEDARDDWGESVCGRLAEVFEEPIRTTAGDLLVSASCGWVHARPDDTPVSVLHRADLRMYEVKRARKGTGRALELEHLRERVERTQARSRQLTLEVAASQERLAATRAAVRGRRRRDASLPQASN